MNCYWLMLDICTFPFFSVRTIKDVIDSKKPGNIAPGSLPHVTTTATAIASYSLMTMSVYFFTLDQAVSMTQRSYIFVSSLKSEDVEIVILSFFARLYKEILIEARAFFEVMGALT